MLDVSPHIQQSCLSQDTRVTVLSVLDVSNSQQFLRDQKRPKEVITELEDEENDESTSKKNKSIYKYAVQDSQGKAAYVIALTQTTPWVVGTQVILPEKAEVWRGVVLI